MEQPPEGAQVLLARDIGPGWILLAEAMDPAEQMGIAAQLGEAKHLGKILLEIGQEAIGGDSKISMGSGESLDASIKNLGEFLVGQCGRRGANHRFWGKNKRVRFCTAR